MKAIELRIVFEDDDGKTYVKRYVGEDAENRVTVCGHKGENPCVRIDSPYEILSIGKDLHGPVLRKATEVESRVGPEGLISSLIPDEARKDCTPYRFRFDVTAVRVPEVNP